MPPPRGLIQALDQHLQRRGWLKADSRLLIACSGGADSVALAGLLARISQSSRWHWTLALAHVNHGLRGLESLEDQRLVESLGAQFQWPVFVRQLQLGGGAVSEGVAREARWRALESMAEEFQAHRLVLAHHRDDQAETMLMRLLRGCGLRGLQGIRPLARRGGLRILRPLLPFTRWQLREFLQENQLPWREDLSNSQPTFLRNRIRLELLPLLATYQPAIRERLDSLATQAQDMMELVDRPLRQAERHGLWHRELGTGGHCRLVANTAELQRYPKTILGEMLRQGLIELGASPDRIDRQALREIVESIGAGRPQARDFSASTRVAVTAASVVLLKR